MSDRILVMWDRTIVGELPANASETEIMLAATGQQARAAAAGAAASAAVKE